MTGEVMRAEPLDATRRMTLLGTEVIACENRHMLVAEVARLEHRGEVRRINSAPAWNRDYGQWEMRIRRLKDPRPAWVKPAVITGSITAFAGILVGLVVWLLDTLAAVPLASVLGGALVGLVAVVLVTRSGGKSFSGTFQGRIH